MPVLAIAEVTPRYGKPGDAALFVGVDGELDLFYFPISQVAIAKNRTNELMLSQHEEAPELRELYARIAENAALTLSGEVHCA